MNFIEHQRYYQGRPDKREVPRVTLATIISIDSSRWDLELSLPKIAPELEQLLDKFEGTALEDNPFFEKAFLAAAFSRMNTAQTSLLTVWETIDSQKFLRMYFPVVEERVGFPAVNTLRCWSHDYAPLGVPIVNRDDAGEILDRFLQLIAQADYVGGGTLLFKDIPLEGIFASRLREILYESDMHYRELHVSDRAILKQNLLQPSQSILEIGAKKQRNFRRQLRRLSELGELALERVDDYKDIILRFEEFLLLESSGWKKASRTSMLTIKKTAAFARQAVTELAKSGQSTIFSIRIDDEPVASLIMLKTAGSYFPWKIAINQDYLKYSPGALLMWQVSLALNEDPEFVRADSLAAATSQLVNPIWKDRIDLGMIMLPFGNNSPNGIDRLKQRIEHKEHLRNRVKSLIRYKTR